MGRRDPLSSLIAGGEGTTANESEAARDIDWLKIRRVQHGLCRPSQSQAGLGIGRLGEEELELAEARSRRAMRLAHALAFIMGVLLGIAFMRGLTEEPLLLSASIFASLIGVLTAHGTRHGVRPW